MCADIFFSKSKTCEEREEEGTKVPSLTQNRDAVVQFVHQEPREYFFLHKTRSVDFVTIMSHIARTNRRND